MIVDRDGVQTVDPDSVWAHWSGFVRSVVSQVYKLFTSQH